MRDLSIEFIFGNLAATFVILIIGLVSDVTQFLKTGIIYSVVLAPMRELISLLVAARALA